MSWGWVPVNLTRLEPEIFFKTFKNLCGAVEIPGSATKSARSSFNLVLKKNYWRNHMKLKKKRCCIAVSCFKNWFVFNFSVSIHRRGGSKNAASFFLQLYVISSEIYLHAYFPIWIIFIDFLQKKINDFPKLLFFVIF